jgi:hypothetical protein
MQCNHLGITVIALGLTLTLSSAVERASERVVAVSSTPASTSSVSRSGWLGDPVTGSIRIPWASATIGSSYGMRGTAEARLFIYRCFQCKRVS